MCSRCGADLVNGDAIILLPVSNSYLNFCAVCSKGLEIEHLFVRKHPIKEELNNFWNEEVK